MRNRVLLSGLLSLILAAASGAAPHMASATEPGGSVRTVATGLEAPWGLAFLPDGSALVSERDSGLITRVVAGRPAEVVGRIEAVRPGGEGGLLGLAVAPGPRVDWIYAYYSTDTDNRIVRLAWDGRRIGREQVLVRGIPKGSRHNGGRIVFGPDGMLYAGTGDAGNADLAQNRRSLAGKVLRMTPTGKVPADNPFRGSLVWTMGHRNVQGLAFSPSGRLYASEFGERDVDELNLLRKGRNYGWPVHEGAAEDRRFVNPIAQWSPTAVASPSGVAVAGGNAYVASLRGERLWRVPLSGDRAGTPRRFTLGDLGRLRTVALAPDGMLWVMTNNTDGRGTPREGDDRIVAVRPG